MQLRIPSSLSWRFLHLLAPLLALIALGGSPQKVASQGPASAPLGVAFDCSAQTQIPYAECQALVALYNSTDGPNWYINSGWLTTNTPCSWYGVHCSGSAPQHVTQLNLTWNGLWGSIPGTLSNLTSLYWLQLDSNMLSGSIPAQLGQLGNLSHLDLHSNYLSGSIPGQLGNLHNLRDLLLYANMLSGPIPSQLGNLSNLDILALDRNQLTGGLPTQLGNLSSLSVLSVHHNPLSGPLPASLMNLHLESFRFTQTSLCEPADPAFQAWLASIPDCWRTWVSCSSRTATPTLTLTPTRSPTPTPEPGRPYISSVSPCFTGGYWPSGASLDNQYAVDVAWQGRQPGRVEFTLNGVTSVEPAHSRGASHTYNMGSDLAHRPLGAPNDLRIVAYSQDGVASAAHVQRLIGYGLAPWMPDATLFQFIFPYGDCPSGPLSFTYKGTLDLPIPGGQTPPDSLPFVGGERLEMLNPQGRWKVEAATDGKGSLEFGRQWGISIAGRSVSGGVSLVGEVQAAESGALQLTGGAFEGQFRGQIPLAECPLVDAICKGVTGGLCPLRELAAMPVIGEPLRWVLERAMLSVRLAPEASIQVLNVRTEEERWAWGVLNKAEGGGKLTLNLATELHEQVKASVYGGGGPTFSFKLDPGPALDRVTWRMLAGLKLRVFRYESVHETGYTWPTPEAQAGALGGTGSSWARSTGWQVAPRDYADEPAGYAVFQGSRAQAAGAASAASSETVILSNAYPEADPALTIDGRSALLLWVHDDLSKPVMQGEEIYYSRYDGAAWSTPAAITRDALQDFAPQVASTSGGRAVAVWERVNAPQTAASTLNLTYTRAIEIAYAVWDGAAWSAPQLITRNAAFDHTPILARSREGRLLLIWRQNPAGELVGTAASPDTVMAAFWDGSTWSTPQPIVSGAGIVRLSAACHDGSRALVVYAQDTAGNLGSDEDWELYAVAWNGAAWGQPTRLTHDAAPDASPSVFYDPFGRVQLFWLKGDTLQARVGGLEAPDRSVATAERLTMLDYRAALDPAGNVAIVWQGSSPEGVDVYYATYDAAHNTLGARQQLTRDAPLERAFAPAFAGPGELALAFSRDQLVSGTVTLSPTLAISDVTTFGRSDLVVLQHNLAGDLALGDADLSLSVANPAPGSTVAISATLRNVGGLAIANPQVAFYQGDPAQGGALIGLTQTVPLSLGGGLSATVGITWTVPISGPVTLYAVASPGELADEHNPANNTARLTTALPDLTVTLVSVGYLLPDQIRAEAYVRNAGVIAGGLVTITFRLDDPQTGPVLGTAPARGNLPPGYTSWGSLSVSNLQPISTGWHRLYAIADAEGAVPEADEGNNVAWTSLGVLPELDLSILEHSVASGGSGPTTVRARVTNWGERSAANVPVGIYATFPISGSVPLAHTTVSVNPRQSASVALQLDRPLADLYVGVNIDRTVAEREPEDNVAAIGSPVDPTAIPTSTRTPTRTRTPTPTATVTPSLTSTPTVTPTLVPTPTPTRTPTGTAPSAPDSARCHLPLVLRP